MKIFDAIANDFCVSETRRHHSRNEIRERRDAVHEDPESRESSRTSEDTAENETEGKHEIGYVSGVFGSVNACNNEIGKGGREH